MKCTLLFFRFQNKTVSRSVFLSAGEGRGLLCKRDEKKFRKKSKFTEHYYSWWGTLLGGGWSGLGEGVVDGVGAKEKSVG